MSAEDRKRIREYFDEVGEFEWNRLVVVPRGRVALAVHKHFLKPFVKPGDVVLEVGAGPGHYTMALADMGAVIDVSDISPVQLRLNKEHVAGTDAEKSVRSRSILDLCDTSKFEDDLYDVILAYGGPLSYVFEDAQEALAGLLRVTKPGGYVVGSVFSKWGGWRFFFDDIPSTIEEVGHDAYESMVTSGDMRHVQQRHVFQMYSSEEVACLVAGAGGELVSISASNWSSVEHQEALEKIEANELHWRKYLEFEILASAQPGAVDGGTHILFAVRKPHPQ